MKPSAPFRKLFSGNFAFIVLVLITVVIIVVNLGSGVSLIRYLEIFALTALYLGIGIILDCDPARFKSLRFNIIFFGIELLLGGLCNLLSYGAAGMLYDEVLWHGPAQYCFATDHGHRSPASLFESDVPLAERFRALATAKNPQFLFSGEAPTDVESQYYYVSYLRIGPAHVALDRYIDPFKPMLVAVVGYDDREMINHCLMDRYILSYEPRNFKGRLSEFPLTMAYGGKVDALREKYRGYLWDAEFRDTLGAEVTVDGKPYQHYSVFGRRESGKRAVVIINDDAQKPIEADLTLEGAAALLRSVTPEDPTPRRTSGKVSVAPRSTVVVLEGLQVP